MPRSGTRPALTAGSRDEAERLAERCRQVFESDPIFVSEIGPVVGVHTGPGLLGVGGVPPSVLT
jgi:fatty acid-binding protein DegV